MSTKTKPENDDKPISPGGRTDAPCSPWRHCGQDIRHNDAVRCKTISAVRGRDIIGRVVQVREGCGQFGSCVVFLRMPDEGLETFENEWFELLESAPFPPRDYDTIGDSYTIGEKWPESGFIVSSPQQPETPGSFTMIVTQANRSGYADGERWTPASMTDELRAVACM